MGQMVSVCCDSCGLEHSAPVGRGMSGIQRTLCACYVCHRLYISEGRWWGDDPQPASLTCTTCGATGTRLLPEEPSVERADDEGTGRSLGRCPECDGRLFAGFLGSWD